MKRQTNRSKDDKLLESLLLQNPGRSTIKLNKKNLISFVTILVAIITFMASVSQILGITINSFFEDVPVQEALRIDYQYRCSSEGLIDDTISGKKRLGVLFFSDKLNDAKQIFTHPNMSEDTGNIYPCVHPSLSLDLVSNSRNETIKVAPYLVIKITEKVPLSKNTRFGFFGTARGAGSQYHYALATVSPMQNNVFAALIQPDQIILKYKSQSEIDFYTLTPGEREAILTFFMPFPGYKYKFQVGAFYSYKGERHIKWIEEQFQLTGVTEVVDEWLPEEKPKYLREIRTIGPSVQSEFRTQVS